MSRLSCHPFEVPHGQRPAVTAILSRHGLVGREYAERFPGHLDPARAYTAPEGSGGLLYEEIRSHAPEASVLVWTNGTDDEPGTLDAYAPGLGECCISCYDDGIPLLHPAEVRRIIDQAACGMASVPAGDLQDAVRRAAAGPWTDLAARSEHLLREERAGLVLLCGTCLGAVTGEPDECAGGCSRDSDHDGLCLRPSGTQCQWCGAGGRLHEASLDDARAALPVASRRADRSWALAWPAMTAGTYETAADAWAAWRSGQFACPEGPERAAAAEESAFCQATGVGLRGEGGAAVYEVRADVPGYPAQTLRACTGTDGDLVSVTRDDGTPVRPSFFGKAAGAVDEFRRETRYQEHLAAIRASIDRHGGPGCPWTASLRDGSGRPHDRDCDYLISPAGSTWETLVAAISPADLARLLPDLTVTDETRHDPARRAAMICDYLDREGIAQGACGPTLTRHDQVKDPVTGTHGTVLAAWCEPGGDGAYAERARIAFHDGPVGSTEIRDAATIRKLPRPVSGIAGVIDLYAARPRPAPGRPRPQGRPGPPPRTW